MKIKSECCNAGLLIAHGQYVCNKCHNTCDTIEYKRPKETIGFKNISGYNWDSRAFLVGVSKADYVRVCAELGDVIVKNASQTYTWDHIKTLHKNEELINKFKSL